MNREQILAILYEMACVIGGEVRLRPLLTKTLQKLLFHTSFPCGMMLFDAEAAETDAGDGACAAARLEIAIGDQELAGRMGELLVLPTAVLRGGSELKEDGELLAAIPGRPGSYRVFMRLPVDGCGIILLLAPGMPETDLPLARIFAPVMGNLAKAIQLCRSSEAYTARILRDQRQAEAALKDMSYRNQLILDSVGEGICGIDLNGNATFVNPAAAKILGYEPQELEGMPLHDLLHHSHDNGREMSFEGCPIIRTLREGGQAQVADEVFTRKDGSSFPAAYVSTALVEEGRIVGAVMVFQDITARKEAEAALRRLNEELEMRVRERTAELEATNRELETFSYSVSHDLRAPLRHIEGYLGVLFEECDATLDPTARQYLVRIDHASHRMHTLIDALLKLSRLSRSDLVLAPVDLSGCAAEIAALLRQSDPGRAVDFVIAPEVTVRGDEGLLRVVLENLIGNAWKYTRNKSPARIEFGTCADEQGLVCFVKDNGAGFDMAEKDRLFVAFQRLHGEKEFEGSGIGLATVQRIIHRHGGRVWAEGDVGSGATFYFSVGLV